MENKSSSCYALIKESHEKLEYIKLYKNEYDAYMAMWKEFRDIVIPHPTYRSSSCTHEIIFDINTNIYLKWYIKEMDIKE
jgi:hypothetical protein